MAKPTKTHRAVEGLLPYEKFWGVLPEYAQHVRSSLPDLYAQLRTDPKTSLRAQRRSARGLSAIVLPAKSKKRQTPRSEEVDPLDDEDNDGVDDDEEEDLADLIIMDEEEEDDDAPYAIDGGVALLSISGPMTKHSTSAQWLFGGTSTRHFRRLLRHAANNSQVKSILIDFDTPGGSVSGTSDLGDDIAAVDRIKPVEAYVADLCASAGYWAASQCRKITASKAAQVGSIGVYMVVEDYSKMYQDAGVAVQVIRAGEFKGAGEDGTEITDAQVAKWQAEINAINDIFTMAVSEGRGMTAARVKAVNTGEVWIGEAAIPLGLIDAVGSYDGVLSRMKKANAASTDTTDAVDPNNVTFIRPGVTGARNEEIVALANEITSRKRNVLHGSSVQSASVLVPAADRIEEPAGTLPDPGVVGTETNTEPLVESPAETTEETIMNGNGTTPPVEPTAQADASAQNPLLIALAGRDITSLAGLEALFAQAKDGADARALALDNIKKQTARVRGAEKAESMDFGRLYGSWSLAEIDALAADLKDQADASMRHPEPVAGGGRQTEAPNLTAQVLANHGVVPAGQQSTQSGTHPLAGLGVPALRAGIKADGTVDAEALIANMAANGNKN